MSRRNLILIIGAIFGLAIVITVISFSHRTTSPVKVRIGYLNITASLPLFVAEEKGFFAEEGIQYDASPLATSNQLVDAVVAGNVEMFPESSAAPVLAVQLQSPGRLKIFSASAITKSAPFDAILVKDSSPITKLSDL